VSDTSPCCTVDTSLDTHQNDPGQDALRYRVGTWSDFYERMKLALSRTTIEDDAGENTHPLADLSTRATDDPTIALLDAWAVVLDVLTFYQERIANEGFLRTATERRSVLELARQIGYELSPGVAASTRLAFTVDDAKGAPGSATVPVGLAVMSIPGQDETPQTFETVEEREVRAAWNTLLPVQWEDSPIELGTTEAYISGVSSRLQAGDAILIIGDERATVVDSPTGDTTQDERWDFRVLTSVETFPEDGYTKLGWERGLGWSMAGHTVLPAAENVKIYTFRVRTPIFGYNATPWIALDLSTRVRWYEQITGEAWPNTDSSTGTSVNVEGDIDDRFTEWPEDYFKPITNVADDDGTAYPDDEVWVDLDGEQKGVLVGSWVVFLQGTDTEIGQVQSVSFQSRSDFGLTAKITRVQLDTAEATIAAEGEGADDGLSVFRRRRAVAFAQSEELSFAQKPVETPFPSDDEITAGAYELSALVEDLEEGAYVFVTGEVLDDDLESTGETATELLQIATLSTSSSGRTLIYPETPLESRYLRSSVTINANVLLATHGETVSEEVLGSGDGSVSNPSFTLRKSPLTYVSAATASGAASTLTLRVDGIAWTEVSSLYEQEAAADVYVIRVDDDALASVTFGDGVSGARLPSGSENVTATYRFGLGDAGNVDAGKLQLMKKRPLGVRSVTNPVDAKGGEDPESLADARDNAPLTVLTLDRLVSLSDYEDFTRSFAGIAKAGAVRVWNGERQIVYLTIAGVDGATLAAGDETYDNLLSAIQTYRDPTQRVQIASYSQRYFRVRAELLVDDAYVTEDVYAEATAALQAAFSFDAREFAQSVTAAEIVATLAAVAGVTAVDLNSLELMAAGYDPAAETETEPEDLDETSEEALLSAVRLARQARWEGSSVKPAELLLLDTSALGVVLEEMN